MLSQAKDWAITLYAPFVVVIYQYSGRQHLGKHHPTLSNRLRILIVFSLGKEVHCNPIRISFTITNNQNLTGSSYHQGPRTKYHTFGGRHIDIRSQRFCLPWEQSQFQSHSRIPAPPMVNTLSTPAISAAPKQPDLTDHRVREQP